ncbi:MAG: hypothetical protein A2Z17_04725 [Gammaproteobacteria bacterium RBG_16_66_13]|nr:MAG: hypothetical protein A2Z17_04725 [Gammaproteobacteria bacterium RBG_16_66_13]
MSFRGLRSWAIALPLLFVVIVHFLQLWVLEPRFGDPLGHLVTVLIMGAGIAAFSLAVFRILEMMHQRSEARSRELAALDAIGRHLSSSLRLDESLSIAMDDIAEMTGADAVGIALSDESGRLSLKEARGASRERLEAMIGEDPSAGAYAPGAALIEGTEGAIRLTVPLQARGKLLGVLLADSKTELRMTQQEAERFLGAVASQVAVAIERSLLIEGLEHQEHEAQALYRIGLEISRLQDLSKILRIVAEQARELLKAEVASVCTMGELEGAPALHEWSGPASAFVAERERGVAPMAMVSPHPEGHLGGCALLADGYRTGCLAAPLIVGTRVVGEMCVAHRGQRDFGAKERALLRGLADMAAIAVSNANLLARERGVAVLEERDRLAREMHDSLAQVLGYLHLKSKATAIVIAQGDEKRAAEELSEIADLAHEAYIDVREAILGLRESVSPSRNLVSTLSEYVSMFGRQAGITARFEPSGSDSKLSPSAEVQLVRVIQEALTNVRKHSGARSVLVRMECQLDRVHFTIEDDGCGFDVERLHAGGGQQVGIQTMRERVERVGGNIRIESAPGAGTRVRIELPAGEEGGRNGNYQTAARG